MGFGRRSRVELSPGWVEGLPGCGQTLYPLFLSRGNRRQDIFLDDVDRQVFLKTLAEACQKTVGLIQGRIQLVQHAERAERLNLDFASPNAPDARRSVLLIIYLTLVRPLHNFSLQRPTRAGEL